MILGRDVTLNLCSGSMGFPYSAVLRRWMEARFDPIACESILYQILEAANVNSHLLDVSAIRSGGGVFTQEALLLGPSERRLVFACSSGGYTIDIANEEMVTAADLIRRGMQSSDIDGFRRDFEYLGPELLARLVEVSMAVQPSWPALSGPGIQRREHASLLICSASTRILLDPLSRLVRLPNLNLLPSVEDAMNLDGVLITHSHGDHWHLPSLIGAMSSETLVIVPRVPRLNLLTPVDMEAELTLIGQPVQAPPWGSVVQIGDIEIDVLPFYGEQPTRDPPGPDPAIRSWGNCYRVNTPDFSLLVLVDSGRDPTGSMLDVVRASFERRGPVDVIVACLREFASPFFGGLSHYYASLPFAQLRDLFHLFEAGRLPSTTAGPAGIADLCVAGSARYFLPYANGFQGVGRSIADIGWGNGEPAEAEAMRQLTIALGERGAGTIASIWNCGDSAVFSGGRMQICCVPFSM